MPIKHSLTILMCNFKLVLKLFLFMLIIVLVTSALLIGILTPVARELYPIAQSFPLEQLLRHPIQSLQEIAQQFITFLQDHTGMVVVRMVYIWLLSLGSRFFLMFPLLPIGKILHGKMTTGFDMGLLNATVSTFAQNLVFSLVTSVVLSATDMLLFVAFAYLLAWTLSFLKIFALPIVFLIALTVYSLRMSIVCQWVPEICNSDSKNVFKALKNSFAPAFKQLQKNFLCVFFMTCAFITIVFTTLIPTVGVFPILMVPAFMTAYTAMSLALNFTYRKQKYFIDNGVTVYNPVKKY